MERSDKKITIKDIAQLAGVSVGTVDRVIHNRGEVSEKTKQKVRKITEMLNFQPDVLASALASKKNVRFAILMPSANGEGTFWKYPMLGIDKALLEIEHYGVLYKKYLFSVSDKNTFIEQAEKAMMDHPDGLIMAPSFKKEATEIAELCAQRKIPVVLFNSSIDNQDHICYVGQDAFQSGLLAGKLMDYGSSENGEILIVSLMSLLQNNQYILARKQGFLHYFENKNERNLRLISLEIDGLDVGAIYHELRKAFSENPTIKGIFVTNSRVFQVARFLEAEKKTKVNLIGYDLTSENKPCLEKNMISFLINQQPLEQGYRAVNALFNKLVLKKEVPKEILIPIDIVTKENLKYYEEY
ncbi:MAG: LacI family DNA-binding transcriptional regulator [Bacteroidales bacterium]|nr:LacI family DNA-binding transcriptional regulator [Bacteroidales bacterium]